MAIKWRVRRLAEAQGMNLTMLSERTGMAYSSIVDYWYGRARRVDLRNLERLCVALNTTPCEVLEYLPGVILDEDTTGPESEELPTASSQTAGPVVFAGQLARA